MNIEDDYSHWTITEGESLFNLVLWTTRRVVRGGQRHLCTPVYIWIKNGSSNAPALRDSSRAIDQRACKFAFTRSNTGSFAERARRDGRSALSTTLDILKIFRTVKSRVLRSASSDIGPATICRSIPAAYRSEGNLPETIRLKSRPAHARIFCHPHRARVNSPLVVAFSSSRGKRSLHLSRWYQRIYSDIEVLALTKFTQRKKKKKKNAAYDERKIFLLISFYSQR